MVTLMFLILNATNLEENKKEQSSINLKLYITKCLELDTEREKSYSYKDIYE